MKNTTGDNFSRSVSLCARCKSLREKRHNSPGRAAWIPSERGRALHIEVEGREARRRHSSSDGNRRSNGVSSKGNHCYIVPTLETGPNTGPLPRTTYKEDFITPKGERRRPYFRRSSSTTDNPISGPPPTRVSFSVPSTPTTPVVQNGGMLGWVTSTMSKRRSSET